MEKIKCQLCGERFSTLATHINRKHNLSAAEYRKRFPRSELISDEHRKMLSLSVKERFVKDPTLKIKVAARTFDFIKDRELKFLLQRDYKSARTCLKYGLWKPSIILYGSIIEAILIEKHPNAENYYKAIDLSYKVGDISEKEYHKIHIIRDLRNFVHLHKELSEGAEIDESWAKTFSSICEGIIKRFSE